MFQLPSCARLFYNLPVAASDLNSYRALMNRVFGYPEFRPGQGQVLARLADSDVLGVMPTGSGKSLCYVLPAMSRGRTVVVSPLIALMRDQVHSLRSAGVRAAFINSSLDRAGQNASYLAFVRREVDLLYVAPERFANGRFVEGLRRAGVNLLAIDEAHCVSEWGHDFRPDYLTLGSVRRTIGSPRTLALTATAEPAVQDDILDRLGILEAERVVTSVDRPNLRFSVEHIPDLSARRERLTQLLSERRARPGIVYARTRRTVEELACMLTEAGIPAEPYHAGMDMERRDAAQHRFTIDDAPVIVATNAFGMGVDKPDVRFVIHFNMPGRLEAYYQQAGRAGRDGEPADCILLYGGHDIAAQRQFIERGHPDEKQVRDAWISLVKAGSPGASDPELNVGLDRAADGFAATLAALRACGLVDHGSLRPLSDDPDAHIDVSTVTRHKRYVEDRLALMVEYSEAKGCRRAMILRYFGESPAKSCTACDSCIQRPDETRTEYPPSLYEALIDLREKLARRTSRAPYQVLESRSVRELATYRPRDIDELMETWGIGEIKANWFGRRILRTIAAWEQANPNAPPRLRRRLQRSFVAPASSTSGPAVSESDPLYARLRAWRADRARRDGVPAFMVFSDRTLKELVTALPRDRDSLMRVRGVGPAKLGTLGPEVLSIINARAAARA